MKLIVEVAAGGPYEVVATYLVDHIPNVGDGIDITPETTVFVKRVYWNYREGKATVKCVPDSMEYRFRATELTRAAQQ